MVIDQVVTYEQKSVIQHNKNKNNNNNKTNKNREKNTPSSGTSKCVILLRMLYLSERVAQRFNRLCNDVMILYNVAGRNYLSKLPE